METLCEHSVWELKSDSWETQDNFSHHWLAYARRISDTLETEIINIRSQQQFFEQVDIGRQFYELAETWREQKGGLSLAYQKAMLPSYQSIIGLGRGVVPFILRELERQPDHWFWALEYLTRRNPVPSVDRGNIRKMTQAWIEWGKSNRLI